MNINKLFKFKQIAKPFHRAASDKFHVIHRESCRWVMNVHFVEAGPFDDTMSYWQAKRSDSTFNAATRAAAVRGLMDSWGMSPTRLWNGRLRYPSDDTE
jgi:hypothetical protein